MKRKTDLDKYEKGLESGIDSHVSITGAKRRKIRGHS